MNSSTLFRVHSIQKCCLNTLCCWIWNTRSYIWAPRMSCHLRKHPLIKLNRSWSDWCFWFYLYNNTLARAEFWVEIFVGAVDPSWLKINLDLLSVYWVLDTSQTTCRNLVYLLTNQWEICIHCDFRSSRTCSLSRISCNLHFTIVKVVALTIRVSYRRFLSFDCFDMFDFWESHFASGKYLMALSSDFGIFCKNFISYFKTTMSV